MQYPQIYLKNILKKIFYFGFKNYCPICKSSTRIFKVMPTINPRYNAICPVCGSLERHRMIWLYFMNKTDLMTSRRKKMLHIAPESCIAEKLSKLSQIDYLSGDLFNPAMQKIDITDINYPDNSFDVIYCSHVLEHIQDDRKAMSELARVLHSTGWAILQVPIEVSETFEDPSIVDPYEREKFFGQYDHVRKYGFDYKNRLEESGFQVTVIPYLEKINAKDRFKYGLNIDKDDIYLCKKT